jgi:uncharacterized protein (TIGR04222 family)
MSPETAEVVARIQASNLDDAEAQDPFSKRLARENGWPELHALRVIKEYKRFLALAMTCGPLASPSDAVDQAWHLHLQYSASYRRFCRDVLGQQLDHGPSSGGADQLAMYQRAYARTLECYAQLFGESPPTDIWPAPSERFGQGHAVRIARHEHWIIPKPGFVQVMERSLPPKLRGPRGVALVMLTALALTASLSADLSGSAYLFGYFALWITCLLAAFGARNWTRGDEQGEPPRLEPYELLQLASGSLGAVDGAVARLIAEGAVEFDQTRQLLRICGPLPATAAALECTVYADIRESNPPTVAGLRGRASSLTERAARRLEALALVATRYDFAFWISLVAPAFAFARILSRLGTDKPVGYLVFWCIVGVVIAYWVSHRRGRTPRGDDVLARARAEHPSQPDTQELPTDQIPVSLALFGVAAVTLPLTAGWLGWVGSKPYSASISSGGCGSGCGGGSCGGGGCGGGGCGGGCGGCGGGCGG